jgi:hypothetical protein
MEAFFGCTLEALLKAAFIDGSGPTADNRCMQGNRLPDPQKRRHIAIVALLLTGLALPPARAGGSADHDRARAAVQAGAVLPLPTLLERLQRSHPGQVLELELEMDDGRWIYEIKLLQADGQLLKLELDAATAQVLKVKRKDRRKDAGGDGSRR